MFGERALMLLFLFKIKQVSELTADLAEEHGTATLATERLEAETAQRMKLDKDLADLEVNQFSLIRHLVVFFGTTTITLE